VVRSGLVRSARTPTPIEAESGLVDT